ncbi:PPOX class F420-dependent oxidoreductase [Kitasatospora indigofera]|uniref:PPOX class F420-dependent oxidoreductase n=1 Tax=Kitasatospora indigofera TaxID=67307 RepID=A0A919FR49_9ACTN|nr:PPOX class F420-dependent oxidoreductase [Kitasatospora indigofera]GHH70733.1 PPOX class F420-dependent oxidoreductase [Kitasatospora indigofera]
MVFTEVELAYLAGQRLGRLATVAPDGAPQNSPVAFRWNPETGTIDIGGRALGDSRKFHNVEANPKVSFIVDDIASFQPWRVRAVEIRGRAEALRGAESTGYFSGEMIRIHPRRVLSWGLDPELSGIQARTVGQSGRV